MKYSGSNWDFELAGSLAEETGVGSRTAYGSMVRVAMLGAIGVTLLNVLSNFAEYALVILAGMAIYKFTGGFAPWNFFGVSLPAYLVGALLCTVAVMARSALGIFLVSPKKESVWGELLKFAVAIPFSLVTSGLMVWTVVALFM